LGKELTKAGPIPPFVPALLKAITEQVPEKTVFGGWLARRRGDKKLMAADYYVQEE